MKHLDETDSAIGLPVFFDAVGRRWRRVRLCWSALVVLVTVLSATFVMSVLVNPVLPRLGLRPISALPHAVDIKPQPPPLPAVRGRTQTARRAEVALRHALATTHAVPSKRPSQMSVAPPPPAWFEQNLASRMRELDPAKTIICLGNYGYDWTPGSEATEDTFQEAVLAARDSEAAVSFDPVSRNPYFSYEEEDGSQHTVWFLDAVTAYNQMRAASGYRPAGYALWRLGSEDPSLWSVFGASQTKPAPDGLRRIQFPYDVDFEGAGEVLQVEAEPQEGAREIKVDPTTGLINEERYTTTPSSYVIRRSGYQPGLVALTFDDGPDPLWTPRILDILKQENVPATFFIIGENGQANPNAAASALRRVGAHRDAERLGLSDFVPAHLAGDGPDAGMDAYFSALERLEHPAEYTTTNLRQVLFYYALFLAVDWVAAAFALMLEKRERWGLLWWLFWQRFCYRQVMYYVMIRSVITAARGALVGWGKLERKATVEAQP